MKSLSKLLGYDANDVTAEFADSLQARESAEATRESIDPMPDYDPQTITKSKFDSPFKVVGKLLQLTTQIDDLDLPQDDASLVELYLFSGKATTRIEMLRGRVMFNLKAQHATDFGDWLAETLPTEKPTTVGYLITGYERFKDAWQCIDNLDVAALRHMSKKCSDEAIEEVKQLMMSQVVSRQDVIEICERLPKRRKKANKSKRGTTKPKPIKLASGSIVFESKSITFKSRRKLDQETIDRVSAAIQSAIEATPNVIPMPSAKSA